MDNWINASDMSKLPKTGPQPVCAQLAVLCAETWRVFMGDQVRIAITQIDANTTHWQAQCYIEGQWIYLTELWKGTNLEVVQWESHFPEKEPYRYITLREAFEDQQRNA